MTEFHVDRRQFLALMGGAAVTTVLPDFSAAADKKTLVAVVEGDPPSLNIGMTSSIQTLMTASPAYSWLIRLDGAGKPEPDLALEWKVSDDGLAYTFKLRPGVTWHDGKPFTSADAKFTIENFLAKIQPIGKNAYVYLASVETPDDLTLVLRFTQPNSPFLSVPFAYGPMLPKHVWEDTNFTTNPHDKAPVGTGAWKFAEYKIGESIRYVKNENYFIKGQPYFDELVFRIMPDAVSRSAAFENGELDTVSGNSIPYTDIPRLEAMPGVSSAGSTYAGTAWMALINMDSGPYAKKPVRQALVHAIDRAFIRKNILPGISWNMVGPIWPDSPLYYKNLVDYEFSADKANALLDQAGFPRGADGTRFELRLMWQTVFPVVNRMADVMKQNLAAVGIKLIAMPLEPQAVIQRGYINGEFDMIIGSYALGPDPDYGTERLYNSANIKPAPFTNNSHYRNPEVDKLFADQKLATSFADRKKIYDRIQEIIWDDVPAFGVCEYQAKMLFRSDYVTGVYDFWNSLGETFARAKPAK